MPGLDGHQRSSGSVKASRRPTFPSFPDGQGPATEVARLRRLGTIGVIAKPFNPLHLGDAVVALWNQRDAAGQGVISRSFRRRSRRGNAQSQSAISSVRGSRLSSFAR